MDRDYGISACVYNEHDPITDPPERYYYSGIMNIRDFIVFINDYTQKEPVRFLFSWVY